MNDTANEYLNGNGNGNAGEKSPGARARSVGPGR